MENLAPKQINEPTPEEKVEMTEKALFIIEQLQG